MQEVHMKDSPRSTSPQLSKRALLSLVLFVVLTFASLTLAWWMSDATWLHFVWVAQAVPVLYVVLMWWGSSDMQEVDDGR